MEVLQATSSARAKRDVKRLIKPVKLVGREPKPRARGPTHHFPQFRPIREMKPAIAQHRTAPEPTHPAPDGIHPRAADGDLVERLLRGDQWAKEALYRRYVKVVWRTALHMLGNRADAQDVVQDTFVEAFRDVASLRRHAALKPWLLRISVHQAHRRFRRRKLLRRLGLDRSLDDAPLDTLLHEEASPELRSELRCVERALRTATAPERFAWILRYVDGHSLEEVADASACSLATAKRRLARDVAP
jgi:RNA polymerase sigma-70 factor, ECF subfamily